MKGIGLFALLFSISAMAGIKCTEDHTPFDGLYTEVSLALEKNSYTLALKVMNPWDGTEQEILESGFQCNIDGPVAYCRQGLPKDDPTISLSLAGRPRALARGGTALGGFKGGSMAPWRYPERILRITEFAPMCLKWECIGVVTPSGSVNTI